MSLYNIDCASCDTSSTVMMKAAPNFCPACGNEIVAEEIVAHHDTTSEPVEYVATAPAPASERLEAPSEPEPERLSFNCGKAEDWGRGTKFEYEVTDAPAQGTQEWLDWRSEGITATEAAAIMFPDQYKSALTVYNQKMGIAPPEDQSDPDGFFEWGHILEDDLVRKFKSVHPELADSVSQGRLYQRNWAKCSLDAQCFLKDGTPCIIECKSSQSASKWNPYPEKYFAQVQWQMYVTGIRKAIIIAVICEGGYHYIEREVEYSPTFVEDMLHKCLEIHRCVLYKTVPEISVLGNPESDKKAIAQLAGDSEKDEPDATITREEYEEYERLKETADKAT
ncbi:MAG: YqaJ viral recombinase family protein, partial [Clostridia bacterium]|nr:YqaJ viral recombinase family protein [Clostridia bacterium]